MLKNLGSWCVSAENHGIDRVKIGKNTFFHPIFFNNDGKCEIAQALEDEFCGNMTQFVMFVSQHADDQLSKERDKNRSVDRLLCPTSGGTDM